MSVRMEKWFLEVFWDFKNELQMFELKSEAL
jgi:hypothetical protein